MNRVVTMVDSLGTTYYTYDAAGQKLTEGGLMASDIVTNTYVNRQRTALSLEQPSGLWTSAFAWDAAGRLSTVTSPAGSFTYAYTALDPSFSGRLVQTLSLPTGAYITNYFDSVARALGTSLDDSGGSPLDSALYGYNAGSQRTAYTNAAGQSVTYAYDPIGQLKIANSSVSGENRGYNYDAAWNLNYRTNNGSPQTFTVNSLNELTAAPAGSLSYDPNGNLTNRAGNVLLYDDENRLIQWSQSGSPSSGSLASTFAYDGLGRLRARAEYQGDGSQWVLQSAVNYLYDGWRVIQERDTNNWPQVAYTRGTDLSGSFEGAGGIGGLLARSHDFTNCDTTLTYWLTNNSGFCIYDLDIWDDTQTYVSGAYIAAGDIGQFSFTGVPGGTYHVHGWSCDEYYIQDYGDPFTGVLDTRSTDFLVAQGDWTCNAGENCATDSGLVLCDVSGSGSWLCHTYYHADANGNVTCLIDSSQTVVASYRYDPYGNILSQSGDLADANTYRFSSKELCLNSGLYYYGYRFYDPNLHRWTSRDPLADGAYEWRRTRQSGRLGPEANLYTALDNDPVDRLDPDGRCSRPPPPKPGDPYGCWAAGNPKKLPKGGPAKPVNCLNIRTGCYGCCEDKFPIMGGDPKGYASCIASCDLNYTWCAAYGTTTPIVPAPRR